MHTIIAVIAIALQQAGIDVGKQAIEDLIRQHAALPGLQHLFTLEQQQPPSNLGGLFMQEAIPVEFDLLQLSFGLARMRLSSRDLTYIIPQMNDGFIIIVFVSQDPDAGGGTEKVASPVRPKPQPPCRDHADDMGT